MYIKVLWVAFWIISLSACHQHKHGTEQSAEHEDPKFQYTVYSDNFELFAEADPFIVSESANVLSHFSILPDFKAVESGTITLILSVNGKETRQTLNAPTRKGIYSFDIKPELAGVGKLRFEIDDERGNFELSVSEVTVFSSHEEAHEAAENEVVSRTNASVFTKEQSWKIDFSTGFPSSEPFGQVIKTTALLQSSQGSEIIVTAKTNGVVRLTGNTLLEGKDITSGQAIFTISGEDFADNNSTIRFAEARNNYEKNKADYERAVSLAQDKIVSEKDLLEIKNRYDNSKTIFDNLNKHFTSSGQNVTSPVTGFIKQLFVSNGTYVEAGQPILTVAQNKTLLLTADVPQKYANVLGSIQSANIRSAYSNQTYTLEALNGKILSFGKSLNSDNYLIPVNIQIDNKGDFLAGSFVEIYLKTISSSNAVTIPNTALMEEQGIYYVWVQLTPELFEKREISIGKTDGIKSEVLRGIDVHDRIVTSGATIIKLAQATGALDAHSGHVH